jgi:hypothetical protein
MRSVRLDRTSDFARALVALALAVAIAGCGSSSDSTGITGLGDITGTYTLRRVDGALLPFTFPNGLDSVVVDTATFVLNHDGTYSLSASGSDNGQQGTIFTDDGEYIVTQSTITFTSNVVETLVYSANATPGTFTVSIPGVFVHSGNAEFNLFFARAVALPQ